MKINKYCCSRSWQVGSYLLNELNVKKKDIELKTGKKINVVAISAKKYK